MIIAQPLEINNRVLRNRIVMPPMATRKAVCGSPSEEQIDHYAERAGAASLVIVEHSFVSPEGMASKGQLSMADDSVIGGFEKLTKAVRAKGALIWAQINHAGGAAKDTGLRNIAPSAVSIRENTQIPEEMTRDDIYRIVSCFKEAAVRAKKAGFDGVEIHSAHGYLLNQFYSPLSNKRTDEYCGTTLEGRTRLHTEIIRAVREAVGPDLIVALRFGACDYMEGGSEIKDIPAASRIFENAGIDVLDISGGHCMYNIDGQTQPGWFSDSSLAARQAVNVPVILTGGIKKVEDAERLLEEGAADLIGVGRSMLEDAGWAQRALDIAAGIDPSV